MSFEAGIAQFIAYSNVVGNLLWGWYTQAFILLVGAYLLVGTRFYVFRKFGFIMKNTLGKAFDKQTTTTAGLTPWQAVLGAVAGTIGMGNIAGTASAIAVGGPGAMFWMWIFAFLGMSIKMEEVTLALHYREVAPDGSSIYGGPMYYMKKALNAKVLSFLFSIGLILNCLLMASTMQTHTIIESVQAAYNVNGYIVAGIVVILSFLAIYGGLKQIGKVCEILVPAMTVIWLLIAVVVVLGNITNVPAALWSVVRDAFRPTAAVGGFAGASIALAVQQGAARGTGSNDAGVGVAPILQATADCKHPITQGWWGATEVFFVTHIICSLTALIILTPKGVWSEGKTGVALTMAAIETVIPPILANFLVTLCIFAFCFSTIVAFFVYYQTVCVDMFGEKSFKYLRWLYFILPMVFAEYKNVNALYGGFANIGTGLCLLPNMVALTLLAKPFFGLLKDWESGEKKWNTAYTDKSHHYILMCDEYRQKIESQEQVADQAMELKKEEA